MRRRTQGSETLEAVNGCGDKREGYSSLEKRRIKFAAELIRAPLLDNHGSKEFVIFVLGHHFFGSEFVAKGGTPITGFWNFCAFGVGIGHALGPTNLYRKHRDLCGIDSSVG